MIWVIVETAAGCAFLAAAAGVAIHARHLNRWERHVNTTPGIRRITQFGCGCQWHTRPSVGDAFVPCRQHADPASRELEAHL